MGAEAKDFNNDDFLLSAVQIPQGAIIQREIKKALSGEKFFYNDKKGAPVDCEECSEEVLNYYLDLYQKIKHIGMPHGAGWLDEPEWISDFYVYMAVTEKNVIAWMEHKEHERRMRKGGK